LPAGKSHANCDGSGKRNGNGSGKRYGNGYCHGDG
jgi:hypothetical protein